MHAGGFHAGGGAMHAGSFHSIAPSHAGSNGQFARNVPLAGTTAIPLPADTVIPLPADMATGPATMHGTTTSDVAATVVMAAGDGVVMAVGVGDGAVTGPGMADGV